MIDWLKASLPLNWSKPICGGHFLVLDRDGVVERQMMKSEHVRGSHDEHITLRTIETGRLEFDGNPSKFLQCHNLFGSDDLVGLLVASVQKAFALLGLDLDAAQVDAWRCGDFTLSRVDITESYELDTPGDVRAWLRAASEQARMKYRGRGSVVGSTLYFGKVAAGKRASPWSIKCYAKGDELNAPGKSHKLPEGLPGRDLLAAWAATKLRVELLLRSGELRNREQGALLNGRNWTLETPGRLFAEYAGKIELGTNMKIEHDVLEGLKTGPKMAYLAWEAGQDLSAALSRPTFYRYRAAILEHSAGRIDINVRRATSNVLPLVRVLSARPASAPEFAPPGSPLHFLRAA